MKNQLPLVVVSRDDLREYLVHQRNANPHVTVGFVPTMGALHQGHAALLKRSVTENHVTVLSIFVNPKQFGPQEDFLLYPRTLDDDLKLAAACGVDVVFAPTVTAMYPEGFSTKVSVGSLGTVLCGAFRPGHFDGVATVVLTLFNLVQANRAYFGLKDYQQVAVLRRLCADVAHGTLLVGVPTQRDTDGVALSSRNRYLSETQRRQAAAIPQVLAHCAVGWRKRHKSVDVLIQEQKEILEKEGFLVQYLGLYHPVTLEPVTAWDTPGFGDAAEMVAAVAVLLPSSSPTASGSARSPIRLIDNLILSADSQYRELQNELMQLTGVTL